MLIEGEAGIGKTRVLEAAVERARGRGFQVFVGRGDELERARPFGPLCEALGCRAGVEDPRRAEIVRLLAGEDQARGQIELTRDPGAQFRVVDAFVDLVEKAALDGPVALALEDLQWADPSTIVTLRSLVRRLTFVPVALLASLRPVPRAPDLEGLIDAVLREGAARIALGPLPEEVVAQLVAELVRAQPGSSLLEQVAGAAGNPLFVGELVRALDEEGAIRVGDGRAEIQDVSLPPSLRLTILRRLSFLEDDALELLRVAASLGSTFSLREVATVLDRSATELLQPARKALLAGVLEERESRLAFRHDLIREAIYEDLPEDVRSALHLEVGRRLARSRAPTLQVAEHFALGAQPGDAEAIEWLHAAAHETARSAPTVAVKLLERALDLEDADERRAALLADLVPTLLWSGRPQEAEARAREALEAPTSPDLEPTLRLGLVGALTAQGRAKDVIDEVRNATTHTSLSADVQSQLQAEAANALAFVDQLALAEQTAHEAVTLGRPVQSEGAAMGLLVLCDMARVRGRPEEALALVQDARTLARSGSRLRWPPEVFRAMSLHQLDAFEDAHDALRKGQRADERLGNVSYLPVYHYEAASLLFSAGRWEDAIAQVNAGLEVADEVGLEMLLSWPYGVLALIAVHRDELDAAAASLAAFDSRPGAETAARRAGYLPRREAMPRARLRPLRAPGIATRPSASSTGAACSAPTSFASHSPPTTVSAHTPSLRKSRRQPPLRGFPAFTGSLYGAVGSSRATRTSSCAPSSNTRKGRVRSSVRSPPRTPRRRSPAPGASPKLPHCSRMHSASTSRSARGETPLVHSPRCASSASAESAEEHESGRRGAGSRSRRPSSRSCAWPRPG